MIAVKQNKPVNFSEEKIALAKEIMSRYPEGKHKSALLPILHLAQNENENWLSVDTMDYVANLMNIQPIEVYEVATFYSMYNMKPVGKYLLEICHTGPCCLVGAEKLISYLEKKLQIKVGETTRDGMFTIKTVECLGACGYAPMMQVGETYIEFLNTEEKIDATIDELRRKMISNN